MREIKFRFYDKSANKMRGWDYCRNNYKLGVLSDNDNNEKFSPFMQYTGLKDKNGREIYEGDIVKGYYDEWDPYFKEDNRHEFISDVKYIDNSFKVHRNTVNDEGRIRDYGYMHQWDNGTVEVIGNICEHPHLLEEK